VAQSKTPPRELEISSRTSKLKPDRVKPKGSKKSGKLQVIKVPWGVFIIQIYLNDCYPMLSPILKI
jgi:hypothetical protein